MVVNDQSPVSVAIGEHYAELRGVPDAQLLRLSIPLSDPSLASDEHETISRVDYRLRIRDPIEAHLREHQLEDTVEVIVTTKGIPLKVSGSGAGESGDYLRNARRASVDSELMLLLTDGDGAPGAVANPYYGSDLAFADFRRQAPGEPAPRFLVARLTGRLSVGDPVDGVPKSVLALFERADERPAADSRASWLIDADLGHEGAYAAGDRILLEAAGEGLGALGVDVVHDREPAFVADASALRAYASWGSNDRNDPGPPYYGHIAGHTYPGSFAPRAVAIDFVSTSARTFTAPPEYGQSLISDLLALGAAGAGGYVYEPTLATVARPHLMFDRYARGDPAVEAYWASVPVLGWAHAWVGDPLLHLYPVPAVSSDDRDGDGVPDEEDNCTRIPNAAQRDTDHDDYGNACDPDVNNDGMVTTSWGSIFPLGERGDVEWIALTARSGSYDENHDLDGDGVVDAVDVSIAQLGLLHPAGPSGRRPDPPR